MVIHDSWSQIFDHMTMTPGRIVGQKVKNRGCLTQPPAPLICGAHTVQNVLYKCGDSEIPVRDQLPQLINSSFLTHSKHKTCVSDTCGTDLIPSEVSTF